MKKLEIILFVLYLSTVCSVVKGQETLDLYESGKIPNSLAVDNSEQITNGIATNVSIPQLLVFKAQKDNSNKTAMLICPADANFTEVILQKNLGDDHKQKDFINEYIKIRFQFNNRSVILFQVVPTPM